MSSSIEAGSQAIAGRYEIISLLGSGGMGSVYLARDLELDDLVALKTLSKELVDVSGSMERFRREVKLARRVTHPNVARTFDIGDHEGLRFLTMEYIDGEALSARVARDGAMAVDHALRIATSIGEGLTAAHAAGVIHRDLKPDNVILGKDGRVMITDFGLARAFSQEKNLTAGHPLGTPAYMAPEQVEGKEADHRADIYALGEILFEMLTGACPFHGDTVFAIAAARLMQAPPDACALRVTLPRPLGALIARAMARDPAARFSSVREMIDALAALHVASPPSQDPSFSLGATQPITPVKKALPAAASTPSVDATTKILAVIPFKNLGNKEDDYLASAISESLVDTFSMNRRLRVPSLAAVGASYKEGQDPRELGQRMGAHVVASGSVLRDGDKLRVTARLIGVHDGFQIWARRLEASSSEILQLSDQTADAIVLGLSVEKKAISRDLPEDPITLDLYLRARHALKMPTALTRRAHIAVGLVNEALARAPNEPSILALSALTHLEAFNFGLDPILADEAGRLAQDAAMRALALAPDAGLPHYALGEIERARGNPVAAVHEYSAALRADPRSSDSLFNLGVLRARAGDTEGGLRLLKRAELLDPGMPMVRWEQVFTRELCGDPDAADEMMATPRTEDQAFAYWIGVGQVLMWRRDSEGAKRILAITPNGPTPPGSRMLESTASASLSADSRADLEGLARVGAKSMGRTAFFRKIMAAIAMVANDEEHAMQALLEADAANMYDILWLEGCSSLAPLRTRPEYAEIQRHVRERAAAVLAALQEM